MKSLVRITGPAEEPVSLEEAMAFLRVDNADEAPLIESMIQTARELVENYTGRALFTQTFKLVMDDWPEEEARTRIHYYEILSNYRRYIALDRSPLASVESVKYYPASGAAQATLSAATYTALTGQMPGLVFLNSTETWPDLYDRPDAVEVNFTAGAAAVDAVPGVLRSAVLLALHNLYENRSPTGPTMTELPFSLKSMLESQRVGGWIG